jgi:hypothetical protein
MTEKLNDSNALDIVKSDSISLLTESSDTIIDIISDSKLIDDIPLFGIISKIGKIGLGINNYLFEKKLRNFLFEIKDVSKKDRLDFISKLNKKEYFELGSSITVLLEKYESLTKATYLGVLLRATIIQEISNDDFIRIATILNRLMIFDIEKLSLFKEEKVHTGYYVVELENQGLIERTGQKMIGQNSHTDYWDHFYRLSELGTKVVINLKL